MVATVIQENCHDKRRDATLTTGRHGKRRACPCPTSMYNYKRVEKPQNMEDWERVRTAMFEIETSRYEVGRSTFQLSRSGEPREREGG